MRQGFSYSPPREGESRRRRQGVDWATFCAKPPPGEGGAKRRIRKPIFLQVGENSRPHPELRATLSRWERDRPKTRLLMTQSSSKPYPAAVSDRRWLLSLDAIGHRPSLEYSFLDCSCIVSDFPPERRCVRRIVHYAGNTAVHPDNHGIRPSNV